MIKRKDECYFCKSRFCYTRIVSSEDKGKLYDEVACTEHSEALHKHSDVAAPKVMKIFASGTAKHKRGDMTIFERI